MAENRDAWELWAAVATQWRVGGMGVVGLDYLAVELAARIEGIDLTPALMGKIRALEAATLRSIHAGSTSDSARLGQSGKTLKGRVGTPQKSA